MPALNAPLSSILQIYDAGLLMREFQISGHNVALFTSAIENPKIVILFVVVD